MTYSTLLTVLVAAGASPFVARAQNTSTTGPTQLSASAHVVGVAGNGISGTFKFVAAPDTEVVTVSISIDGLNALNATDDYLYHIHTNPIPSNGNCSLAFGHLDPLGVTDAHVCDPNNMQLCQIGDLSGKHGKLPGNATGTYETSYEDVYLRFFPEPFSLLGRSVVVHYPNLTRIACGNIISTADGTADANGNPTNASSTYITNYPLHAPAAANASAPSPSAQPAPAVTAEPDIILSTSGTALVAASVSGSWSAGQPLPTQSEALYRTMTTPSASSSSSAPGASGSAASGNSNGGAGLKVGESFGAIAAFGAVVLGLAL